MWTVYTPLIFFGRNCFFENLNNRYDGEENSKNRGDV